MKKKLTILAFGLLLAVGWTNVAQAQLKAEYSTKEYAKVYKKSASNVSNPVAKQAFDAPIPLLNLGSRSDFRFKSETPDVLKHAPMRTPNRAQNRAENTVTAKATLTFDEAEAITYTWYDANGVAQPPAKLTDPASDSYQIAYLLGTTYMNPEIPGLKYSAVYDRDNPYPNIEYGWDIPNNSRWPSNLVGPPASSGTGPTTNTWSWAAGSGLPNGWSFVDSNCGWGDNGDGTYYVGVYDSSVQPSSFAITIPAAMFSGYSDITVVIRAKADYGYNNQTITVNGSSKTISTTINNYTWTNVNASNGITIDPKDSFTGLASITITGTGSSTPTGSGGGLTIAAPDGISFRSITVTNQSGTTLQSWNPTTAINSGAYNGYTTEEGGTQYYFTIPGWTCSSYFYLFAEDESGSSYIGYLWDNHIHIPASLLSGNSSVTVTINAYGDEGGERLVVNGEEKTVTTSAANYTWTFTDLNTSYGTVIPPNENGYTIFLVKVNDGVPAAMNPAYTYSWNNGSTSLIDYLDTYIDEVQLLTDGTRLNENTDDAGTMFAYSGELGRFYFLGKGADFWWGSSEYGADPHLAPTYDMYEEFSPTSTDNGADITDFYSKLLYGNSYNVIHDCRGMNYFQHYFTMSGLAGSEHRSMTNLIFWIPDNRGEYGQRNYNEEYLPHVGLYTITLEAEAEPVAYVYEPGNLNYKVTLDWVSSLNSILDFSVDQDYELWIYTYDEQGNPVAERKVTDLIVDENGLIHNDTEHFYYVEQKPDSYTIVYRIKGWPKDASNNPTKGGDFYVLSNLDPVLIPGYNNFISLGVEHYESDFALDGTYKENNYYRNFLTVDNQNPDNPLTPARIQNGDDEYELYRYDASDLDNPKDYVKVADLLLSVDNNKVEYLIDYVNQFYVDEAQIYNEYNHAYLQGYEDQDALGCPTYGEIATISEGGGSVTPPEPIEETQTVADGTTTSEYVPVYGWWYDSNQKNQIIYPASMLNLQDGDVINAITFYTYRKYWSGGTVKVSMGETQSTAFSGNNLLTDNVTQVKAAHTPPSNQGAITWKITLDQPYTYHGGNLLVQIETTAGSYGSTRSYFYGVNNTGYSSCYSYGSISPARQQFMPKTTFDYTTYGDVGGFEMLNNFLDNSTYDQVGQVVFELPWKSIQVKLQDESAGTSNGYFLIQNGGKLRFVMPAGYNDANVKFVIHNAPVSSNYYDGTFTLSSSTGSTQTITIPSGGTAVYGDRDYEVIFEHISSGDVITITGTHTVDGTPYGYSPDFKYIHVLVQGGTGGISMNTALNLDAVKFVDQFKASTSKDEHPKRYGYVLKAVGSDDESDRPLITVQHTNSKLDGYYSLNEINGDTEAPLLDKNVMNAEVNMTLVGDPDIYYYTLDRKPSNVQDATWEAISKLQIRGNDSYQEMFDFLPQYDDQICHPADDPIVPRYDNYNVSYGDANSYNDYMSYVPIIWTHGDQKNRRVKWSEENRHNSYGAPIWKTGVAEVTLRSATAERQDAPSTSWTDGGEDCNLYMLNNVLAEAKMPTVNNVKYVPYMFRIFVKSNSDKLRGYQYVPAGVDPDKPGQHYDGDVINDTKLMCVWSGYMNDPRNIPAEGANYGPNGVSVSYDPATGICTFNKIKVDPTETGGDWDPNSKDNAIFAGLTDIITEENGVKSIDPNDLQIVVRFYYIVEGFNASMPGRGEGDDPAGYGVEGSGDPDAWTAIYDVIYNADIESVTYVNALGMTSDKPFDGMNIVITRYSNGMTTTHKVIR